VDVWLREAGRDARASAARLGELAAAAALGGPDRGLRVIHDPAGRPGLTGSAEGLQMSLSHSRVMAAAAVTAIGPVGVDLEPVRPLDTLTLARRWFPAPEAGWLALLPSGQRDEAFLGLWTQKEAIAKALGTGLRGGAGLRQPVLLSPPTQVSLVSSRCPARAGLRLAAVPDHPGLAVTMAGLTDGAALAGTVVLAVACLGAGADGAIVTVRLAGPDLLAR
jgi:4'-phosphopantetheinyl transferase